MKASNLTDLPSVRDYLARIGAQPISLTTAVARTSAGSYMEDRATIRFSKMGEITIFSTVASDAEIFAPTEVEEKAIKEEFPKFSFPQPRLLPRITNPPEMIKKAKPEDIFEFRTPTGELRMVQVRIQIGDSDKRYIAWTPFDDGEWRKSYPDDKYPLYNADKIEGAAVIFLHEGAKAARAVQDMVDAKTAEAREKLARHPWGRELAAGVHVGWIGGAPNPHRTDWQEICAAKPARVYIVSDNDETGRSAVPKISRALDVPTFAIQFNDQFPVSFDLADPFPEKMFGKIGGEAFYKGDSFRDCMHPATWATEEIKSDKPGRPKYKLREAFRWQWVFVEETANYHNTEMPEIERSENILNKMLGPFSDVVETTRLMSKEYQGRTVKAAYDPSDPGNRVTYRGTSAINLHRPSGILSKAGDITPFIEFVEYMFPNEAERKNMLRWIATLIARPDIRMSYGILLVSEMQGVGKTTIATHILAPLVGVNNVSYPSEADITSPFNSWIAQKRLAVIGEIYSGSSWRAYNSLKSIITDAEVQVNKKYVAQHTMSNWVHVFASSNSERPLKMDNDDRRWFYPKVTEKPWSQEKFDALYLWINSGGLSIIKHWAEHWADTPDNTYVSRSERAPWTVRKQELVEGSRSEAQKEAIAISEMMKDRDAPCVVFMKDVEKFVNSNVTRKFFDTEYNLRKAMIENGVKLFPGRIKIGGHNQYAVMNNAAAEKIEGKDTNEAKEIARGYRADPADLAQSGDPI